MRKFGIVMIIIVVLATEAIAQNIATETTQVLNNIQLILTAARQLESLYNEQTMIQNQIVQLQSVATYQNQFSAINVNSGQISILINQGINNSNQTETLLNQMLQAANNLLKSGTTTQETIQLGQGTMQMVQSSLSAVQTQRQDYQQEQNTLNALLAKSNNAVGQTQAIQVLNQLVGQMILQEQLTRELLSQQINLQAATINEHNQEKQDQANSFNQTYNVVTNDQVSVTFNSDWP